MTIDIISYKLAEGVSHDDLMEAASDIVEAWMKNQAGFISWEINQCEDGSYTDFVHWNSLAEANAATGNMSQIPPDHKWLSVYDMSSVTAKKVETVFSFQNG